MLPPPLLVGERRQSLAGIRLVRRLDAHGDGRHRAGSNDERSPLLEGAGVRLEVVEGVVDELVPQRAVAGREPAGLRKQCAAVDVGRHAHGGTVYPVPAAHKLRCGRHRQQDEHEKRDGGPLYGTNIDYAQVIKPMKATTTHGRGHLKIVIQMGNPFPQQIGTAYVERNNLTIRQQIRRFTRLTLGFSKKLANLQAAVALYFAWYNFCRIHGSLRVTPAMAAGVSEVVWDLERLLP